MRDSTESNISSQLHSLQVHPYRRLRHAFILVYICAISALFYYHYLTLFHSNTLSTFIINLSFILSDAIFAFMWVTTIGYRLNPVKRKVYPENLPNVVKYKDYPALDVFICTADPYKEPPINVVNTALSMMAYDYPSDKISVYVSDDGGSVLTLFALMEAAKFAAHWLPFCKEKNLMDRCPKVYFSSNHVQPSCSETQKMKMLYENMKGKIESIVESGQVGEEYITNKCESQAFNKWKTTTEFTRHEHPTVIQVLLESSKHKDITGDSMPNLVYVSREKSRNSSHHFKAGALNVLLRVSATMTNAPLLLTQDCDMYSNDPKTPLKAFCYFMDTKRPVANLAYVQFPQRFHGISKADIYASEIKRLFVITLQGMDGLAGPGYVGTGCFFRRRAFFGPPSSQLTAEIPKLNPSHIVNKSIQSEAILKMAHDVASCTYENGTNWGSEMGFRYGCLVEDYYTGFRLLCQGWKSVVCSPDRAAFLGDVPITLSDTLSQTRRWVVGLLEAGFSKYSPITFGTKSMGLPMALCFGHYAFWAIWSIPITIYALLPPLALLNQVYVFPEASSHWAYLYMFLFLGAYGQDLLDFLSAKGTFQQWYNDQRMWMIRGISAYPFGLIDYICKSLGLSTFGFNVTSKVVDNEQHKRYEKGLLEFGVESPLFVPLTTAAIINLIAFVIGLADMLKHGNLDKIIFQLSMSGFVVVNCWPIYQAILLRTDRGRMPPRITLVSIVLAWAFYSSACLTIRPRNV